MSASFRCGHRTFAADSIMLRVVFRVRARLAAGSRSCPRAGSRLQAGSAVINGTAMHADKAEAAALVKAQRINIVIGGNDPKASASVLLRELLNRLDQRRCRPPAIARQREGSGSRTAPSPAPAHR